MKNPFLVLVAGVSQSGSIRVFNAARMLLNTKYYNVHPHGLMII